MRERQSSINDKVFKVRWEQGIGGEGEEEGHNF